MILGQSDSLLLTLSSIGSDRCGISVKSSKGADKSQVRINGSKGDFLIVGTRRTQVMICLTLMTLDISVNSECTGSDSKDYNEKFVSSVKF